MITQTQKQLLDHYNRGLTLYKQRKWDEALAAFQQALEIVPGDGPSLLYIARCNEYKTTPPPDNWDGVTIMKTK
ncbi:MAG: tetratricopeptide repeat protein [Spirochaetota bacterium]